MTSEGEARICIGVITGAQGIRGAVRVRGFTADPADIGAYGPVADEAGTRSFRLKVIGFAKDNVTCTLAGITDRNAAEALKGMRLTVPRSALPEAAEEEFYHADLIGLRVELQGCGTAFGIVRALHDFGAGDLIEVERIGAASVMLPFTKAVVPVVDVQGGRVVVALPPGLLDDKGAEDGSPDGPRED